MLNTDLAWAAGIIDGEGSLAASFEKSKKVWNAQISVKMKDKKCVQKMCDLFGGHVYQMKLVNKRGDIGICWCWTLPKINTLSFIRSIYPHLVGKKAEARVLYRLRYRIENRLGTEGRQTGYHNGSLCLTEVERQKRSFLFNELRSFHRVGGSYANSQA